MRVSPISPCASSRHFEIRRQPHLVAEFSSLREIAFFQLLLTFSIRSTSCTLSKMANRNLKQVNIQNSGSPTPPQHQKRNADSPMDRRPNMEEGAQPPPVVSPGAENAGGDESTEMTLDLKSFRRPGEKTFTQRCRLFVGNLPNDITEDGFKKLFSKYGEANEVFINRDRGFGFIRLVRIFAFVSLFKKKLDSYIPSCVCL